MCKRCVPYAKALQCFLLLGEKEGSTVILSIVSRSNIKMKFSSGSWLVTSSWVCL
jgi:hypothetical protein